MIARALFTLPGFDASQVSVIITQATPHRAPVLAFDSHMQHFYDEVNSYWRANSNSTLKEITVVSTGGGFRDILVRSHLSDLESVTQLSLSIAMTIVGAPGKTQ